MKLKDLFVNSKKFSVKHNNFFSIYEKELSYYRTREFNLLEIGILHGGSLHMWEEYFPNAKIFGADINQKSYDASKDDFKIIIGDQRQKKFWDEVKNEIGTIDILIDDGGHTNHQNIDTIINALPLMNNKSKIIIEDTHCSYMKSFGNPNYFSTISFCKTIIDSLNYESSLLKNKKNLTGISNINFYSGLVVIDIDKDLSNQSKDIVFNNGKKFEEDILSNKYSENYFKNFLYKIYKKNLSNSFIKNLFNILIFLYNYLANFQLIKKFNFFKR